MKSKPIKSLIPVGTLCLLLLPHAQAAPPQEEGRWSTEFEIPFGVSNQHMLTPQGKVVSFNGPRISIWNPDAGTGDDARTTFTPDNPLGRLSSGFAGFLPNTNKILIVGTGTENDAVTFNTLTNRLDRVADINFDSAGPEFITLPSGNIFVNDFPQQKIYSPTTNTWRTVTGATNDVLDSRIWLAPNGKVFSISSSLEDNFYYISTAGNGGFTSFPGLREPNIGSDSVMYQPGKLYYPGGFGGDSNPPNPFQINISGPSPSVNTVTGSRDYQLDDNFRSVAIMLPTGEVLNTADISGVEADALEVWNPSTAGSLMVPMSLEANTRNTDITKLRLLKDGRVFAEVAKNTDFNPSLVGRIFTPTYLYNSAGQLAERPTIVSAAAKGSYASRVQVNHAPGQVISRVTLIKIDEQRFQELDFSDTDNGVSVKLPSSADTTPPGYYLMYLIDNKGVPSKGHIINIGASSTTTAFPTASPDFATVTGSGQITIDALANDSGSGLTLVAPNVWSQKGGKVALANNKITYQPKAGFNGLDKIWYVFRDSSGRTNNGVITITVSGNGIANGPYPTAKQDYVTTTSNTKVTIDALANDTGNGLILNTPNVWSLNGGRVALLSNKLVYTPKTGYSGSDKIWYTFKDAQGRSNSGQVNITVKSGTTSAFPVANADFYITTKNTGKVLDILANDTASGGKAIDTLYSYTAKGGWTNKTTNGRVWYKPKAGFTGEDNFWYVMIDAQGRKNSAKVTITVK